MSAALVAPVPTFGRKVLNPSRTSERACTALLGADAIKALAKEHFQGPVKDWTLYLSEIAHPATGVYLVTERVKTGPGKHGYKAITVHIIKEIPDTLNKIFAGMDFGSCKPQAFEYRVGSQPDANKLAEALQKHAAFARALDKLLKEVQSKKEEQKEPPPPPKVGAKPPAPKPFVPSKDLKDQFEALQKLHPTT